MLLSEVKGLYFAHVIFACRKSLRILQYLRNLLNFQHAKICCSTVHEQHIDHDNPEVKFYQFVTTFIFMLIRKYQVSYI